jgi:soluble lytic murein transglycosylase-like protein
LRRLLLILLFASAPAGSQTPALTLEQLPRPTMPPGERGPVVPSQVERWREEAKALEYGDGVRRDEVAAAKLYCRAARYGDAESQFNLGWMLTNARGIQRNDAEAAHLFAATAAAAWPTATPAIVNYVKLVAPEYQLAPALVLAVMAQESNFDPLAESPKKAQGLMQLIPETAARFGVIRPRDPSQNIRGGMAYLRWLLAYYQGDVQLALAAYNAGEKAVDRYLGVPPYAETRLYVRKIMANVGGQRIHPFDSSIVSPSPTLLRLRGG